ATTTAYFKVPLDLKVNGNEGNGEVTYTVANGTGTATLLENGYTLNPTRIGTVIVTASVPETDNYLGGSVMGLVVIEKNKMPLELLVTETVYGDDVELLISGLLENASVGIFVTDKTGSAIISGMYLIPLRAGTVTVTLTTPETTNYQATLITVPFTIKPRPVTLEWSKLTFTYDGLEHAPTAKATDLLGNDECDIIVSGGKINAGTYSTAYASAVTNPNYTVEGINAFAPEFVIKKAKPPIKIITTTATINEPLELQISGNYGKGEVLYMLDTFEDGGVATLEGNVLTPTGLGEVFITVAVSETANYLAGAASAIITIEKPAAPIKLKENTTPYGVDLLIEILDNLENGAITLAIADGTGSATLNGYTLTPTQAGTVVLTVTVAETTSYKKTVKEFEIVITSLDIELRWEFPELIYNGKEQTPVAKAYADGNELSVTVTVEGSRDAGENLEATATAISNPNYSLDNCENKTVTYTIQPLAVELSWTAPDFTYNGEEQAPEATVSNLCSDEEGSEDECTVTVEGETNAGENRTATATGLSNANYKLPDEGITYTYEIKPLPVEIEWGETELIYNGETQAPTATVKGLLGEDEAEVTVSGAQKPVGEDYVATAETITNENYCLKEEYTVEFTIIPLEVMVQWESKQLEYNGAYQTPVATVSNKAAADDVEIVVTGSGKNVSTYSVTLALAGADSANYSLKTEDSSDTFEITVKAITVTVHSANRVVEYTGEEVTFASSDEWCYFTMEGVGAADATKSFEELFPTSTLHLSAEFRQGGVAVTAQEMGSYVIVPVIEGGTVSGNDNYEVTVVIDTNYGTLRIENSNILSIVEGSKYQFLKEEERDGKFYRVTYEELDWVHGTDDTDLTTYVIGQISPYTSVNKFLLNLTGTSKIKLYTAEGELVYDCGNAADGVTASELNDYWEYAIGTGWYLVFNGTETVYLSVLGDVDGNGYIDSFDIATLNLYLFDNSQLPELFQNTYVRLACYIKNEGEISEEDVKILALIIKGKQTVEIYFYAPSSEEEE
ncbi:MAG: hypothetical protein K2N74_00995, partial [Clostridiales bacterium]|nr:hypothetical protein [Clostridiales bacterium]